MEHATAHLESDRELLVYVALSCCVCGLKPLVVYVA
jgi:hypothetical protein